METVTDNTPRRGRGRPRKETDSTTVTARLSGLNLVDWETLCSTLPSDNQKTLLKKCLLAYLALQATDEQGRVATLYAELTTSSVLGKAGERVPIARYLGLPEKSNQWHLGMIAGVGCELNPRYCIVKASFSEKWFSYWQNACATVPNLLPGQILARTIRIGTATLLGGLGKYPIIIIELPDGRSMALRNFLGL